MRRDVPPVARGSLDSETVADVAAMGEDGELVGFAIPSATPYRPDVGHLGVAPRQGMKSAQSQPSGSQVAAGSHTDVRAPIVAGLVLLAVFVRVELRVKAPGFDPRLLAQRTFGGGNAALGFSPMKAGLANIPTAIGALAGGGPLPRARFAAFRCARPPCRR